MKFDIDRFAKLAGIRSAAEAPKSAAPTAPASVLKESSSRLAESAEIKQLRQIIRSETRAILESAKASKTQSVDALVENVQRSRSLTEAMATLGFAGPGFGNNKSFVLGGPMTSASRIASLHEEDEGHDLPYGTEQYGESDEKDDSEKSEAYSAKTEADEEEED